MTTSNDNKSKRDATQPGLSFSFGAKGSNDHDLSGQFPRIKYAYGSNINKAATGGEVKRLSYGGGAPGLDLDIQALKASEYPFLDIMETPGGHVIAFDDTSDNSRVLLMHADGHGIDLRPDGSVHIVANKNRVETTTGDLKVVVEGNAKLVYSGNLDIDVSGDMNVNVKGNYNLNTSGNKNENTKGSDRKTVNGSVGQTIRGSYSTTVTQQVTDTFLAGHSHNVKGTFSNNVDGPANYVSSGVASFTSEAQANMSSPDINIAASSLSAFGSTGVIGGPGIHIKGNEGSFEGSVEAPTFYGNLIGKAKFAALSDKALGANTAGAVAGSGTANYPADPGEPSFIAPSASLVSEYLSKAAGGVRKVAIDIGNFIKNYIDKSEAYGGVATSQLTTGEARSKLRESGHRNNGQFVSSVVSEGIVSPTFTSPTPKGTGRVISGNSTPKFGQVKIGNIDTKSAHDPFLPVDGEASILPDPNYNPLAQTNISADFKLAVGVPISKFLGSKNTPTNLDFIKSIQERQQLAKHLYHHAMIVRSVQMNTGVFKDFRLVVAEGVYRPNDNEKMDENGINYLRSKGRAIVYELYNTKGEIDLQATFDLAEYWKDTLFFDKLILSYDTIDNDKLTAQIIITTPELDDQFKGKFRRSVETQFNFNKLTQGDLVEVLTAAAANTSSNAENYTLPPASFTGENGQIDPSTLAPIGNGILIRKDAAEAWNRMAAAAKADGINLAPSSGYRSAEHQLRLWRGALSKYGSVAAARKWVAPPPEKLSGVPGAKGSMHGWALAVDEGVIYRDRRASNPHYQWLRNNAGRFNFYQRMSWEPWHWEFRG